MASSGAGEACRAPSSCMKPLQLYLFVASPNALRAGACAMQFLPRNGTSSIFHAPLSSLIFAGAIPTGATVPPPQGASVPATPQVAAPQDAGAAAKPVAAPAGGATAAAAPALPPSAAVRAAEPVAAAKPTVAATGAAAAPAAAPAAGAAQPLPVITFVSAMPDPALHSYALIKRDLDVAERALQALDPLKVRAPHAKRRATETRCAAAGRAGSVHAV